MSKYNVYLVAASDVQDREQTACEAKDLYKSPMFCACKTFVEVQESPWLILSDMHGVLWPDAMIAPYDPTQLGDDERMVRVERALNHDVIANTLISILGMSPPAGTTAANWRKSLMKDTTFTLLGESDSLGMAMTELTLAGAKVNFQHKGIPA